MPCFFQAADILGQRLADNAGIAASGVAVLVDRQRGLESEFAKAMAKVTCHGVVVVGFGGGTPENPEAVPPVIQSDYFVTGFFKPILRDQAATPADQVMWHVIEALHNFVPFGHCHYQQVTFRRLQPIADKQYLTYRAQFRLSDKFQPTN